LSDLRTVYDRQPANNRSAIGNRSRLFVDQVDGRSAIARRYRDLVAEHSSDLGGAEILSEAQRQMIRRAASLACWCEAIECKLAEGADIDIGPYTTATNALRRVLVDLGLERRARDLTPTLAEFTHMIARTATEMAQHESNGIGESDAASDNAATADRAVASAAVRGGSSKPPEDRPPDYANMTDREFEAEKAKWV
jgi:hypothetical protein